MNMVPGLFSTAKGHSPPASLEKENPLPIKTNVS